MDLEDICAQTKYPFLGLKVLLTQIQEEVAEKLSLFNNNNEQEFYCRLMGLIEVSIAVSVYLETMRAEMLNEINNQYENTR